MQKQSAIRNLQQPISTTTLLINEAMLRNLPHLKGLFTELYLGPELEYQLEFDLIHLRILNTVFDEIIWQYGLRNVFFRFPKDCDFEKFCAARKTYLA